MALTKIDKKKPSKGPKASEGGRMERKAVRARFRRMIGFAEANDRACEVEVLTRELNWLLGRMKRYRDDAGGL